MTDTYSFRTGAPVDLAVMLDAATLADKASRMAAAAAHQMRTAHCWDGRNDQRRDDSITEAYAALDAARDLLDRATNPQPPVPPAVAARADHALTSIANTPNIHPAFAAVLKESAA